MKMRRGEQGSAILIAMVIVIMVVGIGGAFMMETFFRGEVQHRAIQLDEAQIICDAAVEKVRRALWKYRTTNSWAWNDILTYCNNDLCIPTSDLDTIKARWASEKDNSTNTAYKSSLSISVSTSGQTSDTSTYTDNEAPTPGNPTTPSTSDTVFIGWNRPFGEGNQAAFHVIVKDNVDEAGTLLEPHDTLADNDNVLILVVTATLPDGTQRQIEAICEYQETIFTPEGAIMSDGTIEMGSVAVGGPDGKIHSNEDVYITGNSGTAVAVNASGAVRNSDGSLYNGSVTHNDTQPTQPIPDIDIESLKSNPDFNSSTKPMYVLKSDGTMALIDATTGVETPQATTSVFELKAGKWTFKSGAAYTAAATSYQPASFFVEGTFDASFNGSITMTIIARESINMTGNGTINPYISGHLGLAGKDIRMSGTGNAGLSAQGLLYAKEQISLSGNTNFEGSAVAKDNPDSSGSLVQVSGANVGATTTETADSGYTTGTLAEAVSVSGSVTVTYTKTPTLIRNPNESVKVNSVRRLR